MLTRVRGWYALSAVYVSMLALAVGSVIYSNRVASSSTRKFCSVVVTLDDAYRSLPPTSPIGKKLALDMHQLRNQLHCTERDR